MLALFAIPIVLFLRFIKIAMLGMCLCVCVCVCLCVCVCVCVCIQYTLIHAYYLSFKDIKCRCSKIQCGQVEELNTYTLPQQEAATSKLPIVGYIR